MEHIEFEGHGVARGSFKWLGLGLPAREHRDLEQISRTLGGLLARHDPSSAALLGEGGITLTRKEVCDAVNGLATQLAANGIRREHRIAIVMKNGPDAALSFLSAAATGVAAPLNPAYKEAEFRFAMNDLPATLLLTDGSSLAASAAAAGLGIPTCLISLTCFESVPPARRWLPPQRTEAMWR